MSDLVGISTLMVTIVNDPTGETRRVCLEGPQLFEAIRQQNNIGYGTPSRAAIRRLIMDNAARTYHFRDPQAWQRVQPRYSPQMLATVQATFRGVSTADLAAQFARNRNGGLITLGDGNRDTAKLFDYCAASAYVLTDRGLLAGRDDFGNSLYVITPQILADADKQRREFDASRRREAAAGLAFASRLPGYAALTQRFVVNSAAKDTGWREAALSVSLTPRKPGLINNVDWSNPIDSKTHQARYNGNEFLRLTEHAERLAQQHPWLAAWKATGPDRTVSLSIYGKQFHTQLDEDDLKDTQATWREAGLRGQPYCKLALRWPGTRRDRTAVVYLPPPNAGETRSLLVRSGSSLGTEKPLPPRHWLDNQIFDSFFFHDKRECIVVSPAGEWKRLALPPHPRPPAK